MACSTSPSCFRPPPARPAPIVALATTRRFGSALLAASRNIANRLSLPRALPPPVMAAFRQPGAARASAAGRVEALTCTTAGAEAEQIAELLREAHLRDGRGLVARWPCWCGPGKRMIPGLSRALAAAEIPVEVAGDEIPLAGEPAVRPLLLGLQIALRGCRPDPDEARVLLTSALCGLDSMALRRLGRGLRQADRTELAGAGLPRLSGDLVAAAVRHPDLLDDLEPRTGGRRGARRLADAAARCATAIRRARRRRKRCGCCGPVRAGRSGCAGRPRSAGRPAGGPTGTWTPPAHCSTSRPAPTSWPAGAGVAGFLAEVEGQQIPADTMREADLRGSAVRLLTAHRAKGLEWDLVVVAGVQEGAWPDVRRRGSLLEPDRLSPAGLSELPPTATRIAEERRLFYVACTRARRRLVVTAVAGTEGEGDQPSRFLTELGVPVRSVPGRPRRPLTLPALVAELRRTATDPEAPPALREAAAARLARLAELSDDAGRGRWCPARIRRGGGGWRN